MCLRQAHLEAVSVSHASWNEMASHFEDPYELRTFGPHRPSFFFKVIFLVALAVSAACARFCSFIVARLWRTMVVRRLILATEVAFVVMVRVMAALSVVVVVAIAAARLAILGVIVALLVGVLGLVAMDVARFASKLRQSLPLGLVAFVVAVT